MSENKIESRRAFLKDLGKVAGTFAAVPFVTENLCFSKETLDQIESEMDKIQVKGIQQEQDAHTSTCNSNYRLVGSCECYSFCGSNFHKRANCACSSYCGSHNSKLDCECYGYCGGEYQKESQ